MNSKGKIAVLLIILATILMTGLAFLLLDVYTPEGNIESEITHTN
ncbi:hypothetical protein [Ornithinibacillus californiensis]|nr:hypothetical protein [Ornithinibacillus californiensis]